MDKFGIFSKWSIFLISCLSISVSSKGQYINRYMYSELSCGDLIPRHSSLTMTSTTTTTTSPPDSNTTAEPTKKTKAKPTSAPAVESLSIPVKVSVLNGNLYAPGRFHKVMITSVIPYEGFMIQIRKNTTSIVGTFVDPPSMTKTITCPVGKEGNTVIDNDAPVMLNKINLEWLAPPKNIGTLSLRLSIVIGNEYQTVEISLMPSYLPPWDDNGCGMNQSCFRACPQSIHLCSFAEAAFVAIIRNTSNNESAIITLGAKTSLLKNYAAIGLTKDKNKLSEMDLNICYTPDVNGSAIELAHLYLQEKTTTPLPHQGIVFLDKSYMDGNMLWCQFTRPIQGNEPAKLNLDNPVYLFFFRGYQHKNDYEIPQLRNMMRIPKKVSKLKGLPLNYFVYRRENNGKRLNSEFTLVTLINVFFIFHFLNLY